MRGCMRPVRVGDVPTYLSPASVPHSATPCDDEKEHLGRGQNSCYNALYCTEDMWGSAPFLPLAKLCALIIVTDFVRIVERYLKDGLESCSGRITFLRDD